LEGSTNAFVQKRQLGALTWSTYLGGSGSDQANGIAVDSSGRVFITGTTTSSDFPEAAPLQGTNAGNGDAFAAELTATGTTVGYATFLGGSQSDQSNAMAGDSLGDVWLVGTTSSTNFPVQTPVQATNAGGTDAWVAKINPLAPVAGSYTFT